MRRVRLLVYEGPEEWINTQKEHDFLQDGKPMTSGDTSMMSIDLNEAEITLFQYQIDKAKESV